MVLRAEVQWLDVKLEREVASPHSMEEAYMYCFQMRVHLHALKLLYETIWHGKS